MAKKTPRKTKSSARGKAGRKAVAAAKNKKKPAAAARKARSSTGKATRNKPAGKRRVRTTPSRILSGVKGLGDAFKALHDVPAALGRSSRQALGDVLLEYVRPFITPSPDVSDTFETALKIAAACWNASLYEDPIESDDGRQLLERLAPATDAEAEHNRRVLVEMVERKRQLFPDDGRLITEVQVVREGPAVVIHVTSAQ